MEKRVGAEEEEEKVKVREGRVSTITRKACAPRGCRKRTPPERTLVRLALLHDPSSLPRARYPFEGRRPSRTRPFLATPGCCAPLCPSPSTTSSSSSLPRRERWSTIIGSPGSRRHGTRSCHLLRYRPIGTRRQFGGEASRVRVRRVITPCVIVCSSPSSASSRLVIARARHPFRWCTFT